MWIVILNFCLFVLLVSLLAYGLKHWRNLINEADEEENEPQPTDFFYYRAPFWVLIIGTGIYSLISDLISLLS
jgi:hypothetical protein